MSILESFIQAVPNAGPKAKERIGNAQQRLDLLRARGFNEEADVFAQGLINKIQSKNFATMNNDFEEIAKFYGSNIKGEGVSGRRQESKIDEGNAAIEIERALNIGDERGLVLPASDVKFAAEAIAKGDTKKAADYATRLSSRIESLIKQQDEESKTLVRTPEGEQFSIGDKTGTMYRAGIPVSRGQENTGMFNAFALNAPTKKPATGIPMVGETEQLMQVPRAKSIETIGPSAEVYGVEVMPEKMTSIQEKEQAFKRARKLYNSGDDAGAIDLMNSAGGKGMLGPFMTEDLLMVFGERKAQAQSKQPEQTTQPTGKKTSKGTTFEILQD